MLKFKNKNSHVFALDRIKKIYVFFLVFLYWSKGVCYAELPTRNSPQSSCVYVGIKLVHWLLNLNMRFSLQSYVCTFKFESNTQF